METSNSVPVLRLASRGATTLSGTVDEIYPNRRTGITTDKKGVRTRVGQELTAMQWIQEGLQTDWRGNQRLRWQESRDKTGGIWQLRRCSGIGVRGERGGVCWYCNQQGYSCRNLIQAK